MEETGAPLCVRKGSNKRLNEMMHWKLLLQGLVQSKHSVTLAGFLIIAVNVKSAVLKNVNSF